MSNRFKPVERNCFNSMFFLQQYFKMYYFSCCSNSFCKRQFTILLYSVFTFHWKKILCEILLLLMCDQFQKVNRKYNSNKEGKDQDSIQSRTAPDPGYQWENNKVRIRNRYYEGHPICSDNGLTVGKQ